MDWNTSNIWKSLSGFTTTPLCWLRHQFIIFKNDGARERINIYHVLFLLTAFNTSRSWFEKFFQIINNLSELLNAEEVRISQLSFCHMEILSYSFMDIINICWNFEGTFMTGKSCDDLNTNVIVDESDWWHLQSLINFDITRNEMTRYDAPYLNGIRNIQYYTELIILSNSCKMLTLYLPKTLELTITL
jgi:hypothetical protein